MCQFYQPQCYFFSESSDAIESLKFAKQELKNLRRDVIEKDNLIESKTEELVKMKQEYENKILNERIDNKEMLEVEASKVEDKLRAQRAEFDKILKSQKSDYEKEIERIRKEREDSVEEQKVVCDQKMKEAEEKHKKEKKVRFLHFFLAVKHFFETFHFIFIFFIYRVVIMKLARY